MRACALWLLLGIAAGQHGLAAAANDAVPAGVVGSARALAATCAACHGTDGRPADASMPKLAGRPASQLQAELKAFASGQRPSTVMQQLLRGYSAAQLRAIAEYFEAQDAAPRPATPRDGAMSSARLHAHAADAHARAADAHAQR